MDDKQLEQIYGQPEQEVVNLTKLKCDHSFVRRNATDVICEKCLSGWIDPTGVIVSLNTQ